MPVTTAKPVRVMSQDEFGALAHEVMHHAFEIHGALGRFFDESIYQNRLAERLGSRAQREFGITVSLRDFAKTFRIDLLVDSGAVFELKAAARLTELHQAQTIHYLMLAELNHAKLMNFRAGRVQHEFVNCHQSVEQ